MPADAETPGIMPMVTGFVDGLSRGKLSGWAKAGGDSKPLPVSLHIDGACVETKMANLPRPELVGHIGTIEHGFSFDIPEACRDGETHTAGVRIYDSDVWLMWADEAQAQFTIGVGEQDRALFRHRAGALLSGSARLLGTGSRSGPVALYACYNPTGTLTWSQRRMLEELAGAGFRTILCNSTLQAMDSFAAEAISYCSDLLFRTNSGRDFASWCLTFFEYEAQIRQAEFVLFVNDSFLGPFASLEPIFSQYRQSSPDFFGLTESWDVKHHIQSSLFILSGKAVSSKYFSEFIYAYDFPDDKFKVIENGEIRLSSIFMNSGLSVEVVAPYPDVSGSWLSGLEDMISADRNRPERRMDRSEAITDGQVAGGEEWIDTARTWIVETSASVRAMRPLNPQHVFWKELMRDFRVPLLKKELVFANPIDVADVWTVPALVTELYGLQAWRGICDDARQSRSLRPPPPYPVTRPAAPTSRRRGSRGAKAR